MKSTQNSGRRTFLGAALLGTGAAIGGAVRALTGNAATPKAARDTSKDNQFAYDVSEFEHTDPKWLLYQPAGTFETGMAQPKRIALGTNEEVLVSGDRAVKRFDLTGRILAEIALDRSPHGLCITPESELLVSLGRHFEIRDNAGKLVLRSPNLGEQAFVTSVAVHGQEVFLADAGSREVLVCDRKTGSIVRRFGRKDAPNAGSNPGFIVPSPYFDLALGTDDRLHVTNPGRLRVETYTLDGQFESAWGQPGMRIDRFCGCCNPVYIAVRNNGEILTSEKGLARINLYSATGELKGAVAGPETLVDDKELARRACTDCTVGAGFDIAELVDGRVLALDPYRKSVRTFEPIRRG